MLAGALPSIVTSVRPNELPATCAVTRVPSVATTHPSLPLSPVSADAGTDYTPIGFLSL